MLPEDSYPEVFADEFEKVKLVFELGIIFGESLNKSISSVETQQLKLGSG